MKNKNDRKIRYAVVGLGDIAQEAVLPAFTHAENSELAALISDDSQKLRTLSRRYHVPATGGYEDYEACLTENDLDAVYLALPNSLHAEYAIRAARVGRHVLCEKPLAVNEDECLEIIRTCDEFGVKLMTAYRLHFERSNLEAIHLIHSGKIGEPRIFQSLFTQQVKPGNIRLDKEMGSSALSDVGIYCLNAARYLFRAEPEEVFAFCASNGDPRFREVDEMTTAVLRFPGQRLASFTVSFGAADAATYTVVGTRGVLKMNHSYGYTDEVEMELNVGNRTTKRKYAVRDQFAAELLYFSNCILRNKEPEPSGIEGLFDVYVIQSLLESAQTGMAVQLEELQRRRRPDLRQKIYRSPVRPPLKVHAQSPSR